MLTVYQELLGALKAKDKSAPFWLTGTFYLGHTAMTLCMIYIISYLYTYHVLFLHNILCPELIAKIMSKKHI